MGRHMQGLSQEWDRRHEQICPFAHCVLDPFLLASPLEGCLLGVDLKELKLTTAGREPGGRRVRLSFQGAQ